MPPVKASNAEALTEYRDLITRYGLTWNAEVPEAAWHSLLRVLPWTTIEDRRRAAGLPINPKP